MHGGIHIRYVVELLGFQLDLTTVLASTIVAMGIGFLWYSKYMFGKTLTNSINLNEHETDRLKGRSRIIKFFVAFLSLFLVNTILVVLVINLVVSEYDYGYNTLSSYEPGNFLYGIVAGFLAWLIVATITLSAVLWENKPIKLYLIDSLYYLTVLVVSGGILAIWG